MNLGNYVNDVATSALDGDKLSNCETVEEILEVIKMERARAKSFFKKIKKLSADGVPPEYLIPLGILVISIFCYVQC